MGVLTERQHQVLTALHTADANTHGGLAALAKHLDIHYVTLRQHLNALERKGHLTITNNGRGRTPTIKINNPPRD